MTYLQLCQLLRSEAGLSGTGPVTVVNQTGMYGKVVEWVAEAYREILDMYPWSFLWARVTPELTIGQTAYAGADFTPAVTDLGKVYASRMIELDSGNRNRVYCKDWQTVDNALNDGAVGVPRYFARRPDGALIFYPSPDDTYEIQFEYQKIAPTLSADADTPLIPDATLHKIIVYKALEYYGQFNEDMSSAQFGARQFANMLSRMVSLYVPSINTAATPLDYAEAPATVELV